MVSELAADEEEVVPLVAIGKKSIFSIIGFFTFVLNVISFCIYWAWRIGIIAGAALLIYAVAVVVFRHPFDMFILFVGLVIFLILLMVYVGGLTKLFETFKDKDAGGHLVAKIFILFVAVVLALLSV